MIILLILIVLYIVEVTAFFVMEIREKKIKKKEVVDSNIVLNIEKLTSRKYKLLHDEFVDISMLVDFAKYDISPFRFEVFCAKMFEALGHRATITPCKYDFGRDVIVDGDLYIECKQYKSMNSVVGREVCQKLLGSVQMFKAKKGIIINTGEYHSNAYEVANMVDNLELWDLQKLKETLSTLSDEALRNIVIKTLEHHIPNEFEEDDTTNLNDDFELI